MSSRTIWGRERGLKRAVARAEVGSRTYDHAVIDRLILVMDWMAARHLPVRKIATAVVLSVGLVTMLPAVMVDFTDQNALDVQVGAREGPYTNGPVEHEGIAARLVDRRSVPSGDVILRMIDTYEIELTNQTSTTLSFNPYAWIVLDLGTHPALARRYESPTEVDAQGESLGGAFQETVDARVVLNPGATILVAARFRSTGSPEALVVCARERARTVPFMRRFEENAAERCHVIRWHFPPEWL